MKKDRLSRGKSRQGAAFPVAPPKTALSFSPRNLLFMRAFAENCPDLAKVKQAVSLIRLTQNLNTRHTRISGYPVFSPPSWIPACAGMTADACVRKS
jgi:hypothetical protein